MPCHRRWGFFYLQLDISPSNERIDSIYLMLQDGILPLTVHLFYFPPIISPRITYHSLSDDVLTRAKCIVARVWQPLSFFINPPLNSVKE